MNQSTIAVVEQDIQAVLRSCHGGMMVLDYQDLNTQISTSITICFVHYQLPNHHVTWRNGTVLLFRALLPIIIWGTVQGYACTARTSIEIMHALSMVLYKQDSVLNFQVPAFLKSRCYVFSLWWSITSTALSSAVQSLSQTALSPLQNNLYLIINELYIERDAISLDKSVQLPTNSLSQEQDDDNNIYASELKLIRACQDLDYLSSYLPMIVTVSHLIGRHPHQGAMDNNDDDIRELYHIFTQQLSELSRPKNILFMAEITSIGGCIIYPELSIAIVRAIDKNNHQLSCIITGCADELQKLFHHIDTISIIILVATMIIPSPCSQHHYLCSSASNVRILSSNITIGSKRVHGASISPSIIMDHMPISADGEKLSSSFISSPASGVDTSSMWLSRLSSIPTIRQVLHTRFQREVYLPLLIGLVIHVSIMEDDDKFLSTSSSSMIRYAIIIRELIYPDIMTVYLTINREMMIDFIIGSIIIMKNLTLKKAENMRNIYAKMVMTSKKASHDGIIGIIGILPCDEVYFHHLHQLARQPKIRISNVIVHHVISFRPHNHIIYDDDKYCYQPPASYIATLEEMQSYDRCCWAIIGRVEYIKFIHVNMRCSLCYHQQASKNHIGSLSSNCTYCQQPSTVAPVWEGKFIIDDGTGTCYMHVEGSVMNDMMRAICGTNNECLDEFIEAVESKVRFSGYERYDTFHASRNISSKTNTYDDWFEADDNNRMADSRLSDSQLTSSFSEAMLYPTDYSTLLSSDSLFDPILNLFRKALTHPHVRSDRLQFIVQLIHRKANSNNNSNSSNNNSSDQEYSKKDIGLQQWHDDPSQRYKASTKQVSSYLVEPIQVDCRHVKRLSSQDIQHIAFKSMQQLTS